MSPFLLSREDVLSMIASRTVAYEQARRGTGLWEERDPTSMALNFECRIQILGAKY